MLVNSLAIFICDRRLGLKVHRFMAYAAANAKLAVHDLPPQILVAPFMTILCSIPYGNYCISSAYAP
jgi:hypothetical protein